MADDSGSSRPRNSDGPTPSQAREALDSVGTDASRLAVRMAVPWWHRVLLSLIIAVFTGAQALPGPVSLLLIAGGVIALAAVLAADRRRSGIIAGQPAGPRSKRLLWLAVAVIAVLIAANVAIGMSGVSPWWGLLPAALAFGLALVLGRRYDNVFRSELAGSSAGRA